MSSNRREFLSQVGTVACLGATACMAAQPNPQRPKDSFRLAICNETFQDLKFESACRAARDAGYQGIEIAPFTLSDQPAALDSARRKAIRASIENEGLKCVGLHHLLKAPANLHITTPQAATRRKSWDHLRAMVELCVDLGGEILVLGSGKQRGRIEGTTQADAVSRLEEGLRALEPVNRDHKTTMLLEALAPHLCDVVNTLDEAAAIVGRIDSPHIATLFDVHNAVNEELPHPALVKKHYSHIRHVEVNELDGRYPGTGKYNFRELLQQLKNLSYGGWIALEVFDFKPDGKTIASETAQFLRRLEAEIE